jgi:vacuolar-type H+-ATPase catalytic subunit A/Vma1
MISCTKKTQVDINKLFKMVFAKENEVKYVDLKCCLNKLTKLKTLLKKTISSGTCSQRSCLKIMIAIINQVKHVAKKLFVLRSKVRQVALKCLQ